MSPFLLQAGPRAFCANEPQKADAMPHSLDQLIPSLQSFGVGAYWVLMLAAMAEAIIFVGIIVPGSLMVIAGGLLVRTGTIDFFDLAWFVAAGAIIGAEASYRLGRLGAAGLSGKSQVRGAAHVERAKYLLSRYGGFGMVVARFLGPVSAFVPFSGAIAGMPRRKFIFWNVISAVPYALILPAIGYFMGDLLAFMGPQTGRVLLLGLLGLLLFAVIWFLANRIRRNIPVLIAVVARARTVLAQSAWAKKFTARWPKLSQSIAHRFDVDRVSGLTATVLGVMFIYVAAIYLDSVTDFVQADTITQIDQHVAALLFALRDPAAIKVFAYITALGDATVIATLLFGASIAFVLSRQWVAAIGILIAVSGNVTTVALLKSFFARPRPAFAYFAETSGSFPSGHAAISVAFYGMLAFTLWRQKLADPVVALFATLIIVFSISLSRVYLGEHYLSDVMNGALVGAMWLLIGIAATEWLRTRPKAKPTRAAGRLLPILAVLLSVAFAGYSVATYAQPRAQTVSDQRVTVASADKIADLIPLQTQTLMGGEDAPISFIFIDKSMDALTAKLISAGWADLPTPGLSAAIRSAFEGVTLDEPLTADAPIFWNNRPVAAVLHKTIGPVAADDPILRLWPTTFQLPDGSLAIVGSVQSPDLTGTISAVGTDLGFALQSQVSPRVLTLPR